LPSLRLAIAGDLHGQWGPRDRHLLERLQPDAVLFVGDLSDGDLRLVKAIAALPLPTAVILGNHDHGKDATGQLFQQQLNLLGPRHCAWDLRRWDLDAAIDSEGSVAPPAVSVLGARPGSAGGGFHLSKAITAVYGPLKLEQSATRLVDAAAHAPLDQPLVVLAHVGPSGLGSEVSSLCGRDWKRPAIDWGDQDLALALERIRSTRPLPLVVFGHMHHRLKRGQGERSTFLMDRRGTAYLNAACVPPSVGFDAGANAANTFVLVYNLYDTEDLYKRFAAGEGQAYFVGGLHASYLRRGDVVLIPIRVGAGLRLGVNAGYMRFSKKQRWVPF